MRRIKKRLFALALGALMLLTGCSAAPTEEGASTVESAPVSDGSRYPVEWAKDAVIYEVNVRQYTEEGTFAAFSEHLQTLKDTGINTLWFMPIHPISETKRSGTLGSYYSITDYREVNPEFGTREDFKALVEQAHDMGFHVMLDWVANHTGWDCAWITEHPDWYTKGENGKITDPVGMGWPDVADLNYDNRELWTEMTACMKYWVEEFDIDGFRCDYANGVPTEFWEAARAEIETVKPVLMLAEDNTDKGLLESAFDMNYNWELYDTLAAVANDSKTAYYLKPYIINDYYPDGTYRLNFLDNHDKNSWEKTIAQAFGPETLPSMFSLLYTIPGTPLIYTGDEIGLDHNIAFMEKDAIDWESSDVSYRELLAYLSAIRSENPALHSGNYGGDIQFLDTGKKSVMAFTRQVEGSTVTCIFNLCKREMTVDVTGLFDGTETVLLYGQGEQTLVMEPYSLAEDALEGEVTLQPWEFWIIRE